MISPVAWLGRAVLRALAHRMRPCEVRAGDREALARMRDVVAEIRASVNAELQDTNDMLRPAERTPR